MYGVILGKLARSAESRLHPELSQSQVIKYITTDLTQNRYI